MFKVRIIVLDSIQENVQGAQGFQETREAPLVIFIDPLCALNEKMYPNERK